MQFFVFVTQEKCVKYNTGAGVQKAKIDCKVRLGGGYYILLAPMSRLQIEWTGDQTPSSSIERSPLQLRLDGRSSIALWVVPWCPDDCCCSSHGTMAG